MKNFITWLTEILNVEDDGGWTIGRTKSFLIDIHLSLLSENDLEDEGRHYGDCTKQNITCKICLYQTYLDQYETYCRKYVKDKLCIEEVEIIANYGNIFKGTILKKCRIFDGECTGTYNSMYGTYEVSVPIEHCKIITNESNS